MDEIRLLELPPGEARDLLATGVPAWLPVNPVEYHGPHLTWLNDGIGADALARDLHGRLRSGHPDWPFVTLPDLGVGCGTCPGPGSRRVPFRQVRDSVLRACHALADMGARRVVLCAFHGDPLHNLAVAAGVRCLVARGVRAFAPMQVILSHLIEMDLALLDAVLEPVEDPIERAALREELGSDFHAGFLETSFILHYRPDAVLPLHRNLPPCPPIQPMRPVGLLARAAAVAGSRAAVELDFAARALGWYGLRPFPAYSTRPHLANAASGRILAESIQARLLPAAIDALDRGVDPPDSPMGWLLDLTLDGRLDLAGITLDRAPAVHAAG